MPSPFHLSLLLCAGTTLMAAGPAGADDKAHPPLGHRSGISAATPVPAGPAAKLLDINVASRSELKTLPGIGDAEAAKIIAGRPYMTKTGLVEKKVLTLEAYDALRSRIVVVHKRPPTKPKV